MPRLSSERERLGHSRPEDFVYTVVASQQVRDNGTRCLAASKKEKFGEKTCSSDKTAGDRQKEPC